MKALTVCQPYPRLIMRRDKRIENRTWPTSYRGPLLIHAGKSREWLRDGDEAEAIEAGEPLVFGAILGQVDLIDCLHIDHIEAGDYDRKYPWIADHVHTEGPWCWVLGNPRRLREPVPYKGAQGLWTYLGPALQFEDES